MKMMICLMGCSLTAWSAMDATQAMQQMRAFDPHRIPFFTENPPEAGIQVTEGDNKTLSALGAARVNENDTSKFIAHQEKARPKIYPDKHAFDDEERLLENPEAILSESCHMEPQPCEESIVEKICEQRTQYESRSCGDHLFVSIKTDHHPDITRVVVAPMLTINLTACDPKHELFCHAKDLIQLHEHCEQLIVTVTFKGNVVALAKQPSCSDPTLVLNIPSAPPLMKVSLTIDEKISEERWVHEDCAALTSKCVPDKLNQCIDPNVTKVMDGVSITKPCWSIQNTYQCATGKTNTCQSLIDEGCSLAKTSCADEHCDVMNAWYQCTTQTCPPDKKVCSSAIPCASGECDATVNEESVDANEGITRLGVLAETAKASSESPLSLQNPSIFTGVYQECEKYPLGIRDCCTDDGWLEGIVHCPSELQTLQKAKLEHRVFYLGHYTPHLIRRYGHCVFPSKLAGIIQLQGRFSQLGIGFGTVTAPNCRGITPEELARLDFKRLDVRELVQEMTVKRTLPENEVLEKAGIHHVAALHQKGATHD